MFDLLRQDVRFAFRALGRSPLFAVVSVLSIAIGVGATTAIVTLANTLLLRPPPGVGHPERVVTLGSTRTVVASTTSPTRTSSITARRRDRSRGWRHSASTRTL